MNCNNIHIGIFKNFITSKILLKIRKICSATILKNYIFVFLFFIILMTIQNFIAPEGNQKFLFAEESENTNNSWHEDKYEACGKTKAPFVIPLDGNICLGFREEYFDNENKVNRKHTGIDIQGEFNQDVLASGNGLVAYIGISPIGGRTIVIRHNAGIRTTYLNLMNIYVSIGDSVRQGEKIATIGAEDDPSSQNTHLHFGIIYDEFYLDPEDIFKISYTNISKYIILKYLEDDFKLE